MGKKKRAKRSGKGGGLKALGAIMGATLRFSFKVLPMVAVFLAVGGIFLGVRDALYADPNLNIQKITVQPADSLTVPQRSHIETRLMGKNILQADVRKISVELEKDPRIQSARLVKNLPAGVTVEVMRRKAVACIRFTPNGSCGLVSEDGVILDIVTDKNVPGLLIEAFETGVREPGIGKQVDARGFNEAVQFMNDYQDHELSHYEPLSRVSLDHLGNVAIMLGTGPQIRMGRTPSEAIKSLEKIVPLLKGEDRSKIEYIDLQFDNVIVKRKR